MKIVKSADYDRFHCTADRCAFTCCQQWKIGVDKETQEAWQTMSVPEGVHGEARYLSDYVQPGTGGDSIRLNPDGRCPFLNEEKLCRLVLSYGEDALSQTCHQFPRRINVWTDHVEYSLDPGCPVVLESLWQKNMFSTVMSETTQPENPCKSKATHKPDPMLFNLRDGWMRIAQEEERSIEWSLKMIFYIALQVYDWDQEANFEDDYLESLEREVYLNSESYQDPEGQCIEQNELFLDVIEKYLEQGRYAETLEPLAELAAHYAEYSDEYLETRTAFVEVWEEIEDKLKLMIQSELYGTLIHPESTLYSVLLRLEWLAILCAVIKQGLCLRWQADGRQLSDSVITEMMVLILRIMGCGEEDIEAYLESSFEEAIWDWGYIGLLL